MCCPEADFTLTLMGWVSRPGAKQLERAQLELVELAATKAAAVAAENFPLAIRSARRRLPSHTRTHTNAPESLHQHPLKSGTHRRRLKEEAEIIEEQIEKRADRAADKEPTVRLRCEHGWLSEKRVELLAYLPAGTDGSPGAAELWDGEVFQEANPRQEELLTAANGDECGSLARLLMPGAGAAVDGTADWPHSDGDTRPTTALMIAAGCGHAAAVRLLLGHGADPSRAVSRGLTPLMLAAGSGSLEVLQLLLDAGADIDAVDDDAGGTAYHRACHGLELECAAALAAFGADTSMQDADGHTGAELREQQAAEATGVDAAASEEEEEEEEGEMEDEEIVSVWPAILTLACSIMVAMIGVAVSLTQTNHNWSLGFSDRWRHTPSPLLIWATSVGYAGAMVAGMCCFVHGLHDLFLSRLRRCCCVRRVPVAGSAGGAQRGQPWAVAVFGPMLAFCVCSVICRVRFHCLCLVFPLHSWLRHCLSLRSSGAFGYYARQGSRGDVGAGGAGGPGAGRPSGGKQPKPPAHNFATCCA